MTKYLCLHCHFYQPPRENPWLETIELQDSAYPYHDWNERITAECYAPNTAARILDDDRAIAAITNNLEKISFNFGPTLLSWMKDKTPDVYQNVLDADRNSRELYSGHGSAIAQVYNHMILPLANRRDKRTQVLWGIRDFEYRFGRKPEGMWLAETAVDRESLEILAEAGMLYTILSPAQAARVRPIGGRDEEWNDVSGARIDPTRAYVQRVDRERTGGRDISLFFYDGPISRAVAFEGLLSNGEKFAERLMTGFHGRQDGPQLFHIATDGETYGHHHKHGEMAMARALRHIESNGLAKITNYGEFLEKHPPECEVEIFENTAWSCAHGVERWRSDCGCCSGIHGEWKQHWRAPLRDALDWLRDAAAPLFEADAGRLLRDPWEARDGYVQVILDRSPDVLEAFLARHQRQPIGAADRIRILKLMELQRHAMLMYTSCGWFFDELSGIETVQVIQYAGRVVQLAKELFDTGLESGFVERLRLAQSNLPERGDGGAIYEKFVKPAMVDLKKVAAHYAISSLFEPYADRSRIYCYTVEREQALTAESGKARLALGQARILSEITGESGHFSFGVLHLGDHNISGGVREFTSEGHFRGMVAETREAFDRADLPQVIRVLDREFEAAVYSLRALFRDEQRRILDTLLTASLAEAESTCRQLYEHNAGLMRFLSDLGTPMPPVLHTIAEFVLNAALRRALADASFNRERVQSLLEEARIHRVSLDQDGLGFALGRTMERMMARLAEAPANPAMLEQLDETAGLIRLVPFDVDLSRVQNLFYRMLEASYPELAAPGAACGEPSAGGTMRHLMALGEKLSVRLPHPPPAVAAESPAAPVIQAEPAGVAGD